MGHFLWNNTEERHKYHLANCQLVSQKKKELGGVGHSRFEEFEYGFVMFLDFSISFKHEFHLD
jgi:hypothetical protein